MAEIPNDDHVARHCRARSVHGTDVDGKEFELRLDDDPPEEYLSVNWFELTGKADFEGQLTEVRKAIPRTLKPKDRIARLNVGKARQKIFQNVGRLVLRFQQIAGGHPTYSGIFDIPMVSRINKAVGMQLAMVASRNLHPAEEATKKSS